MNINTYHSATRFELVSVKLSIHTFIRKILVRMQMKTTVVMFKKKTTQFTVTSYTDLHKQKLE